ncbi:MAG: hypothetical protein ACLU5I_07895 [Alistipes finegoldii]
MSTDVQAIKCLTGSDAEVLEFIVKPNAPAVKTRIRTWDFPKIRSSAARARRQGVHRRGQYGNQPLRPRGGLRHACVRGQSRILFN